MAQSKTIFVAFITLLLGTSCCWLPALIIAIGGGSTFLGIRNGVGPVSNIMTGIGLTLLLIGLYQYWKKIKNPEIILKSTISCPECGFTREELMPTDACQFFYECTSCHTILKPKDNDCCVFCSYGTVCCPPIQAGDACC